MADSVGEVKTLLCQRQRPPAWVLYSTAERWHSTEGKHAMGRAIVSLTFDFDAISGWIARGMASPSPISRGEFGPHVGAPRILELLQRHGIRSSWYIPGHTLETYPDACRQVAEAGHEIGHHGWTHRPPATL